MIGYTCVLSGLFRKQTAVFGKCRFPALFEGARNEAVLRLDDVELTLGTRYFVSCLIESKCTLTLDLSALDLKVFDKRQANVDGRRLQSRQQQALNNSLYRLPCKDWQSL